MRPNYWKFLLAMVQPVTVGMGCLGKLSVDLWINCLLGMHWVGNGRGLRVH